jgi:hypothetical protein
MQPSTPPHLSIQMMTHVTATGLDGLGRGSALAGGQVKLVPRVLRRGSDVSGPGPPAFGVPAPILSHALDVSARGQRSEWGACLSMQGRYEGYEGYPFLRALCIDNSPHSDQETAEVRSFHGSSAVGDLPLTPHVARRSGPCARAEEKRSRLHASREWSLADRFSLSKCISTCTTIVTGTPTFANQYTWTWRPETVEP